MIGAITDEGHMFYVRRLRRHPWLVAGLVTFLVLIAAYAIYSTGSDKFVRRELKKLDSPDPSVRRLAIGNIDSNYKMTWFLRERSEQAFIHALNDSDHSVRHAAVFAVGRMREAARPAIPRLFELLSESDQPTRIGVVRILIDLGPHEPRKSEQEVAKLLSATDPANRRNGLVEVVRYGRDGKRFVCAVAEVTDDRDHRVRGLSIDILEILDTRDALDQKAAQIMIDKYRVIDPDDPRRRELHERFKSP